jgi:hypothetical protein
MMWFFLLACEALDPPAPPPRVAAPPVQGEGAVRRAVTVSSPSVGLWEPFDLPAYDLLEEGSRLGLVGARLRDPTHPWHAAVVGRLAIEPRWWTVLLTERADGCDAILAGLKDAPSASYRALLGCPAPWLDAHAEQLPPDALSWVLPDDREPLEQLPQLVRAVRFPHELLDRFPAHHTALQRTFAACVDDGDPAVAQRCLAGWAALDPTAASARRDVGASAQLEALTRWPDASSLAAELDALGFTPLSDPEGPPRGELIAELARRGRVALRPPGQLESQLAAALELLGVRGAVVDSLHPAPHLGLMEVALAVHHAERRHRAMADQSATPEWVVVGLANVVADAAALDDRLALLAVGDALAVVRGPPEGLEALADAGVLPLAEVPQTAVDTGLVAP